MKKRIQISFIVFISVVLFGGCTGGGSTYEEEKAPAQDAKDIGVGYFVDAPVAGIFYSSGKISGVTDANGTFRYDKTPNVPYDTDISLSVGNIKLGTISREELATDGKLYPNELLGLDRNDTNNTKLIGMLQLLQSLDSDGDPSNEIIISPKTQNDLEQSSLDFKQDINESQLQAKLQEAVGTIVGKSLVSEIEARNHFEGTLNRNLGWSIDTVGPVAPSITTQTTLTKENNVTIEIAGEPNTTVKINGTPRGTLSSSGMITLTLDTSGNDGNKTFQVQLFDPKRNGGEVVKTVITKDATPPNFITASNFSIASGVSLVGRIEAIESHGVSYLLSEGNATFTMTSEGVVSFRTPPLYDKDINNTYGFTVLATDSLGNQASRLFEVIVSESVGDKVLLQGVVYTPIMTGNAGWNIDNGIYASGVIGHGDSSCFAVDVNLASSKKLSFNYDISSESCCDKLNFSINGMTEISSGTQGISNFEKTLNAGSYNLKWCYSKDGSVVNGLDRVQISNMQLTAYESGYVANNNAPQFTSPMSALVEENQQEAITISASDADNNTLSYGITGTDASYFDINSSTGVVRFKSPADYETKSQYLFTVLVNDGLYETSSGVSIILTDLPDTPATLASTILDINETQPINTKVGQVNIVSQGDGVFSATFVRDATKEIVSESVSGLMWQDNNDTLTNSQTWDNANAYCSNLTHGGYNDWRLPSIEELQTIVDKNRYSPAISSSFTNVATSDSYWSSTTYAGNTSYAWFVFFNPGNTYFNAKTNSYYVRCVRDGQYQNFDTLSSLQKAGFERNTTTEIVTDTKNELMWQDNSEAKTITKTWDEAGTYCSDLSLGGYNDWRLPSVVELQTIVDMSRYSPAINSSFTNVTSSYYWSSTTDASYTSNAWRVYFNYGYTSYYDKTNSFYVRCVRGGEASNSLIDLIYGVENNASFTLTGSGSEKFRVDSNGTIYLAQNLDYETNASYALKVTATNSAGSSNMADINITVNNILDAPTLVGATLNIAENLPVGSLVGYVTSHNLDNATITNYMWSGDGGNFEINSSGAITTKQVIDYETNTSFSLSVYAVTSLGDSNTVTLTINVANSEEPPTLYNISYFPIADSLIAGANIANMVVESNGSSPITNYVITSGNELGYFDINASGYITVASGANFHYYEQKDFTLVVTAVTADGNGSESFDLNITKADDIYLRSVVYDNNLTPSDVSDDKLYIYFDRGAATMLYGLSENPNDDFNITGSGVLAIDSLTDYNSSFFDRYTISATGSSVPFDTNGDRLAIASFEAITDSMATAKSNTASKKVERLTPVLKTGQTTSYAANDDGAYQSGVTRSYTRANDIVTDNVTGLMWQDDTTPSAMTWDSAINYCEDLTLGGYNDWRLPSRAELLTIVDRSRVYPSIDSAFLNVIPDYYWSFVSYTADVHYIWGVLFEDGGTSYRSKTYDYYVRCVRSGE